MRVAIVGAGLAGLSCAQVLHAHGVTVTLFDKGRQPGGRVATRRVGDHVFNHGTPWLHEPIDGLDLQRWDGGWAGPGDMAELVGQLAPGPVQSGRHVSFLTHGAAGWTVLHRAARQTAPGYVGQDGDMAGPFDAVVLAVPAPQASALLQAMAHSLAPALQDVTMVPVWTLMAACPWPGVGTPQDDVFSLIVQDSARPGRTLVPSCWVAHARPDWSAQHLDAGTAPVQTALLEALVNAVRASGPVTYAAVHRWRYARTAIPLGQPCLAGADRLIVCGDWCLGPNTSDAVRSGQAAAAALL